jgi:hypothetical protein
MLTCPVYIITFYLMSELIKMQNFYLHTDFKNVPYCHLIISSVSGVNVYFSFHIYIAIRVKSFSFLLTSLVSSLMFLQISVAPYNY